MLENILSSYAWFDHPDGPKFVETHRNEHRTSGHWLFLPGAFSSFHKVTNNDELWLIHVGKLILHIIEPDGTYHALHLGFDFDSGEKPVISVPANSWQAAEIPLGIPFAFGTNVCAPVFIYDYFEIATRESLLKQYPHHKDIIWRMTRED